MDDFLENFQRGGGGSFPIQQISLQIYWVNLGGKSNKFSERGRGRGGGVISDPKNFIAVFLVIVRPFGSFPKNHPFL